MAIEFRVEVRTNNPFNQARLLGLVNDLRKYENEWALDLIKRARIYPPPTPAQRAGRGYKRTYRFKNSWRHFPSQFIGQDLVTRVENDTPYARRVVGDDRGQDQANVHQLRWPLFRTTADFVNGSPRGFAIGVQRIIDRHISGIRYLTSIRP